MNEQALKEHPDAGKLFVVENIGVKGALPQKFKG